MHAAQNYIYIVFAVLYIIYSIIKAGKKVTKNRPTVQSPASSQKQDEFKPVQPPTASPIPNSGDDMKKMLEEILGKKPEIKIPEKQMPKAKPLAVPIKTQPSKTSQLSVKKERTMPSHVPVKIHKGTAKSFLSGEKDVAKKIISEPMVEEEAGIDFDIRQAIIYSEILKRPQY